VGFTRSQVQQRAVGMGGLMRGGVSIGTAGQSVTRSTVAGLPTIHRAWSFASNAVACLTMGVWRGEGVVPERVLTTSAARLFRGVPCSSQDWYRFWFIVQKSRESRNVAYVWKTKNSAGVVTAMTALHPDQVYPYPTIGPDGSIRYAVTFTPWYPRPDDVGNGIGSVQVGRDVIWPVYGDAGCGELIPPTPIELFARSLGIALAKQDYEANLYQNGMLGAIGVTFPPNSTKGQADEWSAAFQNDHAGTRNVGRPIVVGGGATLAQIGMTPKDQAFVEAGEMSTLDAVNMTGVPAWVLNANEKSEKSMSPEQQEAQWVNHGLHGRVMSIQSSLFAEPDIFGPASKDYPQFDTGNVIHPDSRTADDIAHQRVQDGRMLADEWRLPNGMPPLPNGAGMIPQETPVGGAPNPAKTKE